ncbi:MAG: DUF2167 domain-containing protein [Pseudomonadota bacterium]
MRTFIAALCVAFAAFAAAPAFADGHGKASPNVAEPALHAGPVAAPSQVPLTGRSGRITLDHGLSLNVPTGWKFYPPPVARNFLQRANAAAPNGDILGLLAPASERVDANDAWACVVSYGAIGYVRPETANGLFDPNFENDVKNARASQNRPFEGFATQPAFNANAAVLTWAERTAAPGVGGRDLRYEQKALGRQAVVGFTSLGTADQMPAITSAQPVLLGMLSFPDGQHYSNYNPATDQLSSYGLPGLITGVAVTQVAQAAPAQPEQSGGGINGIYIAIAAGVVAAAGAGWWFLSRRKSAGDANITPET